LAEASGASSLDTARAFSSQAVQRLVDLLDPDIPKPKKKLRLLAILAAAAPIAWIVGRILKGSSKESHKTSGTSEPGGPVEGR
jgi:hypothetical protein